MADRGWKRYEKQRPGHHVQIYVKFIEPITTGSAAESAITKTPRSTTALDYVLSRLPFQVEKIQIDNGAEFQSSLFATNMVSRLTTDFAAPDGISAPLRAGRLEL